MKRIAMLLSNPFRPDPRVLKEANSLAGFDYEVAILAWDRQSEFPQTETLPSGVKVIRIKHIPSSYGIGAAQLLRLPRFWRALLPYLDELQPDLIHCHDFDTLPAGLLWGRLHRKPVVYDAHEYYADLCKPRLHGWSGDLLYRLIRWAELIGARLSSAVVTVDHNLARIYQARNPRVLVVGHYPSLSLVSSPAPVFSHPEINLLYMGRLSQDRGLRLYLDLLQALGDHGISARLHLAGVFTPESEREICEQRADQLGDCLVYHGWVAYDRVPELLKIADIGLVILSPEPRYIASLPVKLFEYMAAGLPVIASDFPMIRDVVASTNCGALVNPQDALPTLVETLQAWRQNPSLPQSLGENGRRAIFDRYNWEKLSLQLSQLYQSLIKS